MSLLTVLTTTNRRILKNAPYFGITNLKTMSAEELVTCDFEVFGRVQGVFFRKYTANQASSLGVKGWVMNTHSGTVKGQLEGPVAKINEMKRWLECTGSPSSRIDKAVFTQNMPVQNSKFQSFTIKK